MTPILSILIPTTPDRVDMFTLLYNELHRQLSYMNTFHSTLGVIEILVDDSKKFLEGGLSIGKKREALVKRATGKYLCFLDSDDFIAPNYLETLVRLCQEDNDVICFRNFTQTDNYWAIVDMRLDNVNHEINPFLIASHRTPWIICPIRSIFAKMYEFPDISYGEDAKWIEQVLTKCKTESYTNAVLHLYNHSNKHSEADKITKYVQSIK